MKKQRPVNLNLFTIHFPLSAIASILHRISGFILFLLIPFILWGLSMALSSAQSFEDLHQFLLSPFIKFLVWCGLSAFLYHFVAGIRHLLMNLHIGEELKSGKLSAQITLVTALILITLTGIWLW